jgi:hypothetical protein
MIANATTTAISTACTGFAFAQVTAPGAGRAGASSSETVAGFTLASDGLERRSVLEGIMKNTPIANATTAIGTSRTIARIADHIAAATVPRLAAA